MTQPKGCIPECAIGRVADRSIFKKHVGNKARTIKATGSKLASGGSYFKEAVKRIR